MWLIEESFVPPTVPSIYLGGIQDMQLCNMPLSECSVYTHTLSKGHRRVKPAFFFNTAVENASYVNHEI